MPPSITVSSPAATVFSPATQCEALDIPDSPLRAFRRNDGRIVAFASHYISRRLMGTSLSKLINDCKIVYEGGHLEDPEMFDDRTWVAATWTDDGVSIVALGHNEYQANEFPGRCPYHSYNQCWSNSIVPLRSLDSGAIFKRVNYPNPILMVSKTQKMQVDKPTGFFSPSNILFSQGFYYTLIAQSGIADTRPGRCLFRSKDVQVPSEWAVWHGGSYQSVLKLGLEREKPKRAYCEPVEGMHGFLGSISKISGTDLFAACTVEEANSPGEGGSINSYYSRDLRLWKPWKVLLNITPAWSHECPSGARYSYPSVLSDFDKNKNFDTIYPKSWLFLTKISCLHPLERKLMRYQISLAYLAKGPKP